MPGPKTLGRVDWMPRLKVWRVIRYKGAADIPAGDYPTKEEAEDALRELVARGNPGDTPEVTEPTYKVLGRTPSGEANLVTTDEGVLLERIATGKQKGWWKTIIGETEYVAQTRERVLEIARERGAILPKAKAITPEVAIPKAEAAVKGTKAPAEKGSLEQKANALLPMPPTDGPPLPRMFDLKWPWKK